MITELYLVDECALSDGEVDCLSFKVIIDFNLNETNFGTVKERIKEAIQKGKEQYLSDDKNGTLKSSYACEGSYVYNALLALDCVVRIEQIDADQIVFW